MPDEGVLIINTTPIPWTEIADKKRNPQASRVEPPAVSQIQVRRSTQLKAIEKISLQQQEFDPNAERKKDN